MPVEVNPDNNFNMIAELFVVKWAGEFCDEGVFVVVLALLVLVLVFPFRCCLVGVYQQ